jgi:prophage regulatory protein
MEEAKPRIRRLLNRRQLRDLGITFCREHLWRLEASGKFPRRVYLSQHKIAWFEDEIYAWQAERDAERDTRVYRVHE